MPINSNKFKLCSLLLIIVFTFSIFFPDLNLINFKTPTVDGNNINKTNLKVSNVSAKKWLANNNPKDNFRKNIALSNEHNFNAVAKISQHRYQPYFELGGAKYFDKNAVFAGIYDLFIPLLQNSTELFFTDLRIFDRRGGSFEGNIHLGYRKLHLESQRMFGIYGAFDHKISETQNSFNQLTFGLEYWWQRWFIGGNIYQPVGKIERYLGEVKLEKQINSNFDTTKIKTISKYYEKSLSGVDTEIGYAISETVTSYLGGYYFYAKNTSTIAGPKISFTYNYHPVHGRILRILDGISIEAGGQYDKPRGMSAYIGIRFKVGITSSEKNSNIAGFARHMLAPVRRDPDVVLNKTTPQISKAIELKKIKLEEVSLEKTLEELLEEFGLPKNAAWQDVRSQYKKYALKYHPDKNKNGKERFVHYSTIYTKLSTIFTQEQRRNKDNTQDSPNSATAYTNSYLPIENFSLVIYQNHQTPNETSSRIPLNKTPHLNGRNTDSIKQLISSLHQTRINFYFFHDFLMLNRTRQDYFPILYSRKIYNYNNINVASENRFILNNFSNITPFQGSVN